MKFGQKPQEISPESLNGNSNLNEEELSEHFVNPLGLPQAPNTVNDLSADKIAEGRALPMQRAADELGPDSTSTATDPWVNPISSAPAVQATVKIKPDAQRTDTNHQLTA